MKAITVENLSKVYSVATAQDQGMSFREMLTGQMQSFFTKGPKKEPFYALKDISFEVEQGEVLGIIGKNGSGKSTLLKILSKITAPTSGRAIVRGRVASLLEVGTGFHAELTGRENIFMSGIILGMKRWEINKHFDEIVSFAGVGKFLDLPVKKYSSGMRLRLAFSVAAHLQPEILLVDEVLAVGDYEFEKKCLKAMEGISKQGRTILFVSHNMDTVARLTTKVLHLEKSTIVGQGLPKSIIENYLGLTSVVGARVNFSEKEFSKSEFVALSNISILNQSAYKEGVISSSEPIEIEILYKIKKNNARIAVIIYLYNASNELLSMTVESSETFFSNSQRDAAQYKSICSIPKDVLQPGSYSITLEFANAGVKGEILKSNLITRLHKIITFSVSLDARTSQDFLWPNKGIINLPFKWDIALQ